MGILARSALLSVVIILTATAAAAHQLIPGVDGVAAMLLHPLAVTDHLLAIVALGLLAGRSASIGFTPLLLALGSGLLAGCLMTAAGVVPDLAALAPLLLAAICGTLAALAWRIPRAALIGLAALTGLAIASATPPEEPGQRAMILTGIGAAIGTVLPFILFAALARSAERDWQKIALRVAGSWIAACSLLVLTLAVSRAWR